MASQVLVSICLTFFHFERHIMYFKEAYFNFYQASLIQSIERGKHLSSRQVQMAAPAVSNSAPTCADAPQNEQETAFLTAPRGTPPPYAGLLRNSSYKHTFIRKLSTGQRFKNMYKKTHDCNPQDISSQISNAKV